MLEYWKNLGENENDIVLAGKWFICTICIRAYLNTEATIKKHVKCRSHIQWKNARKDREPGETIKQPEFINRLHCVLCKEDVEDMEEHVNKPFHKEMMESRKKDNILAAWKRYNYGYVDDIRITGADMDVFCTDCNKKVSANKANEIGDHCRTSNHQYCSGSFLRCWELHGGKVADINRKNIVRCEYYCRICHAHTILKNEDDIIDHLLGHEGGITSQKKLKTDEIIDLEFNKLF